MKYLVRILTLVLICVFSLQVMSASGQEQPEKKPWTGKLADGTVITEKDLSRIIAEHKKWLETNKEEGQKANLTEADLREANLTWARFEPKPGSLPYIPAITMAINLSSLRFAESSHGLVALREALKTTGLREQERQITYAIERTKRAS